MQKIRRGLAFLLVAVMLGTVLPVTSLADVTEAEEEVVFNTEYMEITVGWEEDDERDFYTTFDADGDYTIELAEEDPFFPYEVQFQCDGETTTEWFESEDSTVTVGGHRFSVAVVNGEAQYLSFQAGGQSFTVYPEEKEFVHDPSRGIATISLLPLKEVTNLTANLSGIYGSELADVTIDATNFSTLESAIVSGHAVWAVQDGNDNFTELGADKKIDLSPYSNWDNFFLEFIVGTSNPVDQLDPDNTRYIVEVQLAKATDLLDLKVFTPSTKHKNENAGTVASDYSGYRYTVSNITLPQWNDEELLLGMAFKTGAGDSLSAKVYASENGYFATEKDLENAVANGDAEEITSKVWGSNCEGYPAEHEAGYSRDEYPYFTVALKRGEKTIHVFGFDVYVSSYRNPGETLSCNVKSTDGTEIGKSNSWGYYDNGYQYQVGNAANARLTGSEKLVIGPDDYYETSFNDASVEVYKGSYTKDTIPTTGNIAGQIWGSEAEGVTADCRNYNTAPVYTVVLKDKTSGLVVAVLPVKAYLTDAYVSVSLNSLTYDQTYDNSIRRESAGSRRTQYDANGDATYTYTLYRGLSKGDTYYVSFYAHSSVESAQNNGVSFVKKAVVGNFATEGAMTGEDIKGQLFTSAYNTNGGYGITLDNVKGVTFTVLDKYDGIHHVTVKAISTPTAPAEQPYSAQSDDTYFRVNGAMVSADGSLYNTYYMQSTDDSYYYNGYQTVFLLNNNQPVTENKIYPIFWTGNKVNVYASHDTTSGAKQESGKTPADFTSGKAIHYSAGSESGTHLKNYWVTFVTQQTGGPKLFVNAATNSEHKDETTNNPVREVYLDSFHNYHHDIFIANIGDTKMENLSVTLSGDAKNIRLDPYWTIDSSGTKSLEAFTTVNGKFEDDDGYQNYAYYGELPNVAKIRLIPMIEDGKFVSGEISGTLTITGGNETVTIKLSGSATAPKITTDNVVDGVKYVPYSSVIQTNNMYKADGVEFTLISGRLPNGVTLKPNGEIYGVPQKSGEFTFAVQASYEGAEADRKEFTLTIADNTHVNVWGATDTTYDVTSAIPNEDGTKTIEEMNTEGNSFSNQDQLFVTQGEYSYFIALWLDGRKLTEGTDYTKEEGSTRITIKTQTLKNVNQGTHTLSAEFREGDKNDGILKRAAQNYTTTTVTNAGSTPSTSNTHSTPTEPDTPTLVEYVTISGKTGATIETKDDGTTTAIAAMDSAAMDKLVEQAVAVDKEANKVVSEIKIEAEIPAGTENFTDVKVDLPAYAVANVADKTDAALTVSTPVASVTIPNKSLPDVSQDAETVTITTATVTDRNGDEIVNIDVQKDGKSAGALSGGMKVVIPVSKDKASAGMNLVAVLVDDEGNETIIPKSFVNRNGELQLLLDSASAAIKTVDNTKAFTDEAAIPAWCMESVQFGVSHGLFRGMEDGNFCADISMSRAMLAVLLYRLEGSPSVNSLSSFVDVHSNAWYAEAAAWTSSMGIITGDGSGFNGNRSITRQELATMLYRYVQIINGNKGVSASYANMGGASAVASWASNAMSWAVGSGIISGDQNGNLNPNGNATRGEVACMLMRFVKTITS